LYYYAYLAEEISTAEGTFTVGAGCRGSRDGGRCTFNEFCEWIWKPQEDKNQRIHDVTRPHVTILRAEEDFTQISINSLYNRVYQWYDPRTGYGVTGNVDADRVFDDATDYYDALGKIGGPIGIAAAAADALDASDPRLKAWSKIVTNGKNSAMLLHDMRFQDVESYRRERVAQILGLELEFKPGRNTLKIPGHYNVIDADETIKRYIGTHPTIEADLGAAIRSWETGSESAINHWAALNAANKAQLSCGCT